MRGREHIICARGRRGGVTGRLSFALQDTMRDLSTGFGKEVPIMNYSNKIFYMSMRSIDIGN